MLLRVLHTENNDAILKEATTIVQLMGKIVKAIDPQTDIMANCKEWVVEVVKEEKVTNAALCEELFKLCFWLVEQVFFFYKYFSLRFIYLLCLPKRLHRKPIKGLILAIFLLLFLYIL